MRLPLFPAFASEQFGPKRIYRAPHLASEGLDPAFNVGQRHVTPLTRQDRPPEPDVRVVSPAGRLAEGSSPAFGIASALRPLLHLGVLGLGHRRHRAAACLTTGPPDESGRHVGGQCRELVKPPQFLPPLPFRGRPIPCWGQPARDTRLPLVLDRAWASPTPSFSSSSCPPFLFPRYSKIAFCELPKKKQATTHRDLVPGKQHRAERAWRNTRN